ncbi:MAG: siroheme synthase [Firmicutes bacterium]|nr:siroheme synthase [Bacillota bacterium]
MVNCYPVNLLIEGKPCLVIGGGAVAERKVRSLLLAGAVVTVISPRLTDGLAKLAADRQIIHVDRPYQTGDTTGHLLVICAADRSEINRLVSEEAQAQRILVNVVDAPEKGDFLVPAQVARGDLLLTVSTGGHSPALSRRLREKLAAEYGPEYGQYLELIAKARQKVKNRIHSADERVCFWRETLDSEILALLRQGRMQEAEAKINDAIDCIGIKP